MEVYSSLGKKTDSLDHLCKIIYTKPKYISIFACLALVGCFNSICYLYAHLEVNICRNPERSLEEDYGFERNTDGQLIQIITDKSPARIYFLQGMKCRCENQNWTDIYLMQLLYRQITMYSIVQMWWGLWKRRRCVVTYFSHVVTFENVYFDLTFW